LRNYSRLWANLASTLVAAGGFFSGDLQEVQADDVGVALADG
jgi:hypothetical protein